MSGFPRPHHEKLVATLENDKLPLSDRPRIEQAIERYKQWVGDMDAVTSETHHALEALVGLLNDYRLFLDVDVIFDSENDFLYRQKGQLKLDNSVMEEFLPRAVTLCLGEQMQGQALQVGPITSFSAVYFSSGLDAPQVGAGMEVRTKAQDFAISKPLYLRASHDASFAESVEKETRVAYVVAECKTNLDKTMFQEACATAHDVKSAVVGSRYYLLCEWLDMTPLSTAPTDIDEVLILRKAKRVASNVRKDYAAAAGRRGNREDYQRHLTLYPFSPAIFERFIGHIRSLMAHEAVVEENVLEKGFF